MWFHFCPNYDMTIFSKSNYKQLYSLKLYFWLWLTFAFSSLTTWSYFDFVSSDPSDSFSPPSIASIGSASTIVSVASKLVSSLDSVSLGGTSTTSKSFDGVLDGNGSSFSVEGSSRLSLLSSFTALDAKSSMEYTKFV